YTGATTITKTDVGTYTEEIDITKAAYSDTNLNVTFVAGDPVSFEITPAEFTVTPVDYTGTYDGESHFGGATPSITEGTEIQYSTDGGKTWSNDAPSIKDAGTIEYIVKATNPNYTDATAEGNLTVNRKAVTVTADNKSIVEGSADPELTATVEGLIGDDTIKYSISRDPGNTPGSYKINVTGDEEQGNYVVTFVSGTLTITEDTTPPGPEPEPEPESPTPGPGPGPGPEPTPEPEPEPTPEPTPTPEPEPIPDEPVPQTDPEKYWALANLLATGGTVLTALGMILTFFRKKKDEEEEENATVKEAAVTRTATSEEEAKKEEEDDENKRKKSKFLGLIPAIGSVILFILTEDMRNKMTWTDKYTLAMVIILLVNFVLAYLTRNKKKDDEEEDKPADPNQTVAA
ncbi:MAG: hypothetical protein IJ136_02960, partial [Erysipelotrichaceae bacterium]|nr:hypothetical protein [Erysipelotrichaceae bacterium]